MRLLDASTLEITHFTLCAGIGGLSLGLSRARAALRGPLGGLHAQMRCLGGVDSDPAVCRDFERLTGARGTCLDLFDRDDYCAFHGHAPPDDWREATPADVLAAAGGEHPDILAWSPPCKGFSGLLNPRAARAARYQALNRLVLRALVLSLEAFGDDPPALVLMENVPRIQTRGRSLLDAVEGILRAYGYAVAETTHDCGELGGLAQHRQRFLLVGRNVAKVKPFLYEPPRRRVRAVGEVLGELPLPDAEAVGPMHRLPRLEWRTWMRLALIEAGKDWRSLNDLAIADGQLRDIGVVPLQGDWFNGILGVTDWQAAACTVTSQSRPTTGAFSVADPRPTSEWAGGGKYRVADWQGPSGTVIGSSTTGNGGFAIADPRLDCDHEDRRRRRFNNVFRLVRWDQHAPCVTGGAGSTGGCVADPRPPRDLGRYQPYAILAWDEAARAVTSQAAPGAGPFSVADPRPAWSKRAEGDWATTGHYGVVSMASSCGTVVGNARHDKGSWSVADARLPLPGDRPDPVPLIVALDGTWHRPFTTLELAVLQGFPVEDACGRPLSLEGSNDGAWRMRIGNAVPVPTAEAIGGVMAETLLRQWAQVSFVLSATPVWVRPLAVALSIDLPNLEGNDACF